MLEGATLNIFTGQSISQTKSFTYLNNEMIVSLIEATLDKHQNPEASTEACRSMEWIFVAAHFRALKFRQKNKLLEAW